MNSRHTLTTTTVDEENWQLRYDGNSCLSLEDAAQLRREEKKHELAQKETRWVKRTKLFVFLVIFLAAVAVGTLVFVITRRDENEEFEKEVNRFGSNGNA